MEPHSNDQTVEQNASAPSGDVISTPDPHQATVKRMRAASAKKIGAVAMDEEDALRKMEAMDTVKPQGILFRCTHPNCSGTQLFAGNCQKCGRAPVRLVSNRSQNVRARSI